MRIYYSYHGQEQFRDIDRKEILIGRLSPLSAPDIDLGDDPTVSRKHCRIKLTANGPVIEDLRSTNGTVVDSESVETASISGSSSIRLGETVLRLELESEGKVAVPNPTPVSPPSAPKAAPTPAGPKIAPPSNATASKREDPLNPSPSPKPSSILPPKGAIVGKSPTPAPAGQSPVPKPILPVGGPASKAASASPLPPSPAKPSVPSATAEAKPAEPVPVAVSTPEKKAPASASPAPRQAPVEKAVSVEKQPDPSVAVAVAGSPGPVVDESFRKALVDLFEVPLSLAADAKLEDTLRRILERVLKLIPGAKDGAILIHDEATKRLQVKACIPDSLVVSDTLARRVMDESHGFILERNVEGGTSVNPKVMKVETGMYAPLLSQERALGAIYVDDPSRDTPYTEDDMQFLLAVSHYVATVVRNQDLRKGLAHNSSMLNRVEAKFPGAVQERLMNALRDNQLKPSGTRADLPVLHAELVGFQTAGSEMPVDAATEMLGEYYAAIQKVIFKYDGTIDRFSGEDIVVAFGAPDADEQQNEKAVIAAISMRDAVKDLNVKRVQSGGNIWHLKVGVNLGTVFHGFVGTSEQMTFALVGPGAFRSKAFCKAGENGEVLIGPELYQKVFKIVDADRSSVAHKDFGEFHCYRVKGVKQK
ncbi:MAG: FHA domain-containing protein [Verrucomicrobiae bacterium]|nr:FHA domain-containing protein [Verrucomicrobiae bacterium]